MTGEPFEAALRDNPDDLPGWAAFADWLAERGDPRGEFMRVQLALEDPGLDKEARRKLRKREDDLLDDHGREWAGKSLAKALVGSAGYGLALHREFGFRRGVLAALHRVEFRPPVVAALGKARTLGWLRELDGRLPAGPGTLAPLARAAWLPGLRALRLTDPNYWANPHDRGLPAVLANAGRLEQLVVDGDPRRLREAVARPLRHLRELVIRHVDLGALPVAEVAGNPSLGRLRRLALAPVAGRDPSPLRLDHLRALCQSPHLTGLADLEIQADVEAVDDCEELIESGLLFRLTRLGLGHLSAAHPAVDLLRRALGSRPHNLTELAVVFPRPEVAAGFAAVGVRLTHPAPRPDVALPDDDADDEPYDGDME